MEIVNIDETNIEITKDTLRRLMLCADIDDSETLDAITHILNKLGEN